MRPRLGLFAVVLILNSGCAVLVARSGVDPAECKTREEVHQVFGKPDSAGGTDGQTYEDFSCHRKVSENFRAAFLGLAEYYGDWGLLADLYYGPLEVMRAGWKPIWGYDLRFHYDSTGRVTKCMIDDWPAMPWPTSHHFAPAPTPSDPVSAGSTPATGPPQASAEPSRDGGPN